MLCYGPNPNRMMVQIWIISWPGSGSYHGPVPNYTKIIRWSGSGSYVCPDPDNKVAWILIIRLYGSISYEGPGSGPYDCPDPDNTSARTRIIRWPGSGSYSDRGIRVILWHLDYNSENVADA